MKVSSPGGAGAGVGAALAVQESSPYGAMVRGTSAVEETAYTGDVYVEFDADLATRVVDKAELIATATYTRRDTGKEVSVPLKENTVALEKIDRTKPIRIKIGDYERSIDLALGKSQVNASMEGHALKLTQQR